MYKDFVGSRVTLVVSSRSENLLEYEGDFIEENDDTIVLANVNIYYLMLNFQKGLFGGNIFKYKENLVKVILNKKYIISCDVS